MISIDTVYESFNNINHWVLDFLGTKKGFNNDDDLTTYLVS